MTFLLPTLAVAFAAFCVFLAVRIVNRKERWAKCTLALALGLPVLYVASIGPACWVSSRFGRGNRIVSAIYRPLFKKSPSIVYGLLFDYSCVMASDGWCWEISSPYDTRLEWGIPFYRSATE